ncbi:hypothetical protein MRB53_005872 [Persea americana]|uniref:Uncharacterized protein n=1 Tax=Persea americana TaxID=3435 RepID=A0ACC2MEK2_PERAE|nr:hypothetical protein MRB53_005872 [Persea americana]
MWISKADNELLIALNNQGIKIIFGIPNSMIKGFSSDVFAANHWVKNNISSHQSVGFTHVYMGDLSNMSTEDGMDLAQAMENLDAALKRQHNIKVSTQLRLHLRHRDFSLQVPVRANDDNFLLNTIATIFLTDQDNTEFKFVYDAMVDSFFGAMRDLGYDNTKIVVASGWPRQTKLGDTKATVQNAKTYNSNLKRHIESGNPKNKNRIIETFIWSALDEDRLVGVHEGWKHLGAFVFSWNNLTLP